MECHKSQISHNEPGLNEFILLGPGFFVTEALLYGKIPVLIDI